MKKQKKDLSEIDYEKLSNKMILACTLLIVGNKTFTDAEKIKYLKTLFK